MCSNKLPNRLNAHNFPLFFYQEGNLKGCGWGGGAKSWHNYPILWGPGLLFDILFSNFYYWVKSADIIWLLTLLRKFSKQKQMILSINRLVATFLLNRILASLNLILKKWHIGFKQPPINREIFSVFYESVRISCLFEETFIIFTWYWNLKVLSNGSGIYYHLI